MLPNLKQLIIIGLLALLGALLMSGAMFQNEMPAKQSSVDWMRPVSVAACTDCYYREPTEEEIELAERVWQAAWGQMTLQERMAGVVVEAFEE